MSWANSSRQIKSGIHSRFILLQTERKEGRPYQEQIFNNPITLFITCQRTTRSSCDAWQHSLFFFFDKPSNTLSWLVFYVPFKTSQMSWQACACWFAGRVTVRFLFIQYWATCFQRNFRDQRPCAIIDWVSWLKIILKKACRITMT